MSVIDNLSRGELADLKARIRALENRTTLNNAAIGRSGMEVYDGGSINISNGTFYLNGYGSVAGTLAVSGTLPVTGGLIVSGTERITGSWFLDGVGEVAGTMTVKGGLIVEGEQRVSGTLEITGELNVTGPTKLDGKTDIGGNTTVTGDLDVEGPLDVSGAMDIKGKSTLQNDLDVRNGGKVKVGNMTLDPDVGSGAMKFANGGQVFSDGGSIQVFKGTSVVQVGDGKASLMGDGGNYVTADSTGVRVSGGLRAMNPPAAPADAKANVYMDSSGKFHRIL
jgi:cytoskeletal protein CcmA (bactofilin family)